MMLSFIKAFFSLAFQEKVNGNKPLCHRNYLFILCLCQEEINVIICYIVEYQLKISKNDLMSSTRFLFIW